MVKKLRKLRKTGIIAAALAEIQEEAVKEATSKLKDLYAQQKKARKVLRNIEREIEDYLMELEIDEEDEDEGKDKEDV